MKVGTDGVLLGSWIKVSSEKSIIDVGTGTGIIALMIAQKSSNDVVIDAIDINEYAFELAQNNFINSNWNDRLKVYKSSLQDYIKSVKKYDIVVSNPPYYINVSKSANNISTLSKHQTLQEFNEFIKNLISLIKQDGKMYIVLPYDNLSCFESNLTENQLFINKILNIKPTNEKPIKRILIESSFNKTDIEEETIFIESSRHIYSNEYKELTKDFYLNF